MLIHLSAMVEALTVLDRRAIDDLLELCSAPERRGGNALRLRNRPDVSQRRIRSESQRTRITTGVTTEGS